MKAGVSLWKPGGGGAGGGCVLDGERKEPTKER